MSGDKSQGSRSPDEFLRAGGLKDRSLVAELVAFMSENKVWWLAPILIVLALFALLLVLGATGLAPFVYPFL